MSPLDKQAPHYYPPTASTMLKPIGPPENAAKAKFQLSAKAKEFNPAIIQRTAAYANSASISMTLQHPSSLTQTPPNAAPPQILFSGTWLITPLGKGSPKLVTLENGRVIQTLRVTYNTPQSLLNGEKKTAHGLPPSRTLAKLEKLGSSSNQISPASETDEPPSRRKPHATFARQLKCRRPLVDFPAGNNNKFTLGNQKLILSLPIPHFSLDSKKIRKITNKMMSMGAQTGQQALVKTKTHLILQSNKENLQKNDS